MKTNIEEIKNTANQLEEYLLSIRNEKGVWDGKLSSSALSTAVASYGLWVYNKSKNKALVSQGLNWLKENINTDGGFGDTIRSKSNLSTTMLCWSALSIVKDDPEFAITIKRVESWLLNRISSLDPKEISNAILNHYKTDKTFSVPILSMCALAGRLGESGWKYIPQLPYQFAAMPDKFFKWLNLSVVSYAIPALISMGLVRQHKKPSRNPILKLLNKLVAPRVLRVLAEKQPDNGGFLEASPLTAFVLMTLVGAGKKDLEICTKAESFLQESIRPDGSWSIDTNLTTWVTTLAINAFSERTFYTIDEKAKGQIKTWLLGQQFLKIHPFTKTKPGGWAWIDKQGGVPDGDDTSGALIALKRLDGNGKPSVAEASNGLKWLMGIQNNDGGIPTFCKGWGKLPFDASCPDITAHALRAIQCWKTEVSPELSVKLKVSEKKAFEYLKTVQMGDGSWLPLWFGNEQDENHQNPVYGTSQVLLGLSKMEKGKFQGLDSMLEKGIKFLINSQHPNGGWGGNAAVTVSIEETSLAIRALAENNIIEPALKAANWLNNELKNKKLSEISATPIGLYFASLWYYEDLYPIVFALAALNSVLKADIFFFFFFFFFFCYIICSVNK